MTRTCQKDHHPIQAFHQDQDPSSSTSTCPEHFRWIHEDLEPWKSTGITRETVESGKNISQLRIVIKKGKAYVETYADSFQTRDLFTVWGIVQLLRLYPGRVPDLELLFETGDRTVLDKKRFQGSQSVTLPPIFSYCGQNDALDIVFPDWSFWGWAETGIKPWEKVLKDIQESNKKITWKDRIPYAFWKGNTHVSSQRYKLRQCNVTDQHDWNARIYSVHWNKEIEHGFNSTKLEDQCTHRYKIYVEGRSWSVSEKYIIACDSMTLFIKPRYYDFFTRSLVPYKHYWPINKQNMCQDIKYAVDWGNTHPGKAEEIGREGTRFIEENVNMKLVYDYMLHLLTEYAKLMRFEATIPAGAVEVCSENLACPMGGIWREFMVESMVKSPSDTLPCTMFSPYL
ncbi:putative lipopolysaccharide-modifying protein [Medicago truncatula]|uniref:Glycosyltransferase family 90 protein n=2 Tax=Medicago truncatula TaxID=3880 RepID=Q2HRE8_MEDTR|nr:Lipopolysaccharide-modifying protein [Medicago truncatula]AES80124.2 glycosyltransferase family 90 protein [Medicago truncatula]RHN46911.1 putative lipopolysaccharide-modifying protein [Medicago truncatula]